MNCSFSSVVIIDMSEKVQDKVGCSCPAEAAFGCSYDPCEQIKKSYPPKTKDSLIIIFSTKRLGSNTLDSCLLLDHTDEFVFRNDLNAKFFGFFVLA